MLPSARPVTIAETTSTWAGSGPPPAWREEAPATSVDQRKDFAFLEVGEDVVVGGERVVVLRRERLAVALDQAVILVDGIEGLADLRAFGRTRLRNRERGEVHG